MSYERAACHKLFPWTDTGRLAKRQTGIIPAGTQMRGTGGFQLVNELVIQLYT